MEPVDISSCEVTELVEILNTTFNLRFDLGQSRHPFPLLPFCLGSVEELILEDLLAEGAASNAVSRQEVRLDLNISAPAFKISERCIELLVTLINKPHQTTYTSAKPQSQKYSKFL